MRATAQRIIKRAGARLELSIAQQFQATDLFDIQRRGGARPAIPPRNVRMAQF